MPGKAQNCAFISSFQKSLRQHHETKEMVEEVVEDELFLRIGWVDTQTPQRNGGIYFLSGKAERASRPCLTIGDLGSTVPSPLKHIHYSKPQ